MPHKDLEIRRKYHHDAYLRRKAEGKIRDVEQERIRRRMLRAFLEELKSKPCMDCRGLFPPECMDFDHVRGTKRYNVGAVAHVSKRIILEEVEKCDLICSNCHRIRTRGRMTGAESGAKSAAVRWEGSPSTKRLGYRSIQEATA